MSTQEIEPTLAEDLDAAFDDAENVDVAEEVTEEIIEEVPELDVLSAPNSWKKAFHESFGAMPRETQQYILDRDSQYEKGIGEKGQELAGFRQRLEGFDNSLAPLQQSWQMQGINTQDGLNSLVGYAQALNANPQEALLSLAKAYNVDLGKVFEEAPYIDPQLAQYEQQLGEMQQTIDSFTQQQTQNTQNAAYSQLDEFEKAIDSEGNLLRPHFNDVIDDMVMIMQTGRADNLDSAYDTAVRINPDIQATLQQQAAKATAHASQEQANKAKLATKQSVSSTETTDVNTDDLTLNEALSQAWDDAN